jgi:hypothetical protein
MVVRQVLPRVNDSMHVSLHKIGDDIDILKADLRRRLLHINQPNNVFMIKELQQFDFSDDSLGIN